MEISHFIAGQVDLVQGAISQPLDGRRTTAIASGEEGTRAELHRAAQEFESYFISYLMKNMRETVPKGLVDRKGEEVWYSFYDQEIARLATQAGGIGITAFVDAYTQTNG